MTTSVRMIREEGVPTKVATHVGALRGDRTRGVEGDTGPAFGATAVGETKTAGLCSFLRNVIAVSGDRLTRLFDLLGLALLKGESL